MIMAFVVLFCAAITGLFFFADYCRNKLFSRPVSYYYPLAIIAMAMYILY